MCGRLNVVSDPLSQFLMDILGSNTMVKIIQPSSHESGTYLDSKRAKGNRSSANAMVACSLLDEYPSTKYSMFNARSETAAQSPAFKEPYKKRRCLVPISAYFEWTTNKGIKVPSRFGLNMTRVCF